MKLDFEILWFDDQDMNNIANRLNKKVAEFGFNTKFKYELDSTNLRELSKEQKNNHTYDLVLIDYNLGNDEKGIDIAELVRNSFQFTPILFYSNDTDVKLRKLIAEKEIQGVFCTDRSKLEDDAAKLIENFVPTFDRITGMQGLSAQIVTEFDVIFREIIIGFLDDKNNFINKDDVNELFIKEIRKNTRKDVENIDISKDLEKRINDISIGSSNLYNIAYGLLRIYASKMKDGKQKNELYYLLNRMKNYEINVLQKRNKLIHVGKDKSDIMPKSEYPKYRKILREHRDMINKIKEIVI